MIQFPHAKINLGLSVVARRPDGFHEIETIFYPVALHDVVEILPADTLSLSLSGLPVPGSHENNLLLLAWQKLKKLRPVLPPLHIQLHKAIPMGAGLGGGSSDAAKLLMMVNDHFRLKLSEPELASLCSSIGSDCAFFLQHQTCIGTGRGEKLEPVAIDLSGYHLLLIHPDIRISTAWAYSQITPAEPAIPVKTLATLPLSEWKDSMINDFETPVFAVHQELDGIKKALYQAGALYASMTGSGSTIYGIFSPGTCPENATASGYRQHLLHASGGNPVW